MAQTMHVASFGPIFALSTQFFAYLDISIGVYNRTLVSIKKKRRKQEKYSPKAQTTHLASFGPLYLRHRCHCCPSSLLLSCTLP